MAVALAAMLLAHWVVVFETRRLALRAGPPPSSGMAPVLPGEWRADPTGRHEWRYWDGDAWTGHVADEGVASVDLPPEAHEAFALTGAPT
jgi:hypothetical protein